MQEIPPWNILYFSKSLNLTFALKTNENICTSIIRELKDNTNDVNIILLFRDKFNNCMLFIPLDISKTPIITAFNTVGTSKLLNITDGIKENITVYAKIYESVFKLPKILVDNSSNGEDIFEKLFEIIFVWCIMLLLYEGGTIILIIIAEI